jgi:hypothetical protein
MSAVTRAALAYVPIKIKRRSYRSAKRPAQGAVSALGNE